MAYILGRPTTPRPKPADVIVEAHGSIYVFTPLSERARWWFAANVQQDGQRWGEGYVVEHRYARDLAQGAINEGLEVR